MTEIIGKITWIGTVKPYQGDWSLGLRIDSKDDFLNIYRQEDKKQELESIASSLEKGFEVKLQVDGKIITNLEILKITPQKPGKTLGTLKEQLEKVNYKTLMKEAHRLKIKSTKVELVPELTDISKKMACFKATVVMESGQVFEDFGEACGASKAEGGNITSPEIALAYIRMASTRALVRVLRQATCNMETADEEMPDGKLPSDN